MIGISVGWFALFLAGCSASEDAHWSDQLVPSGPCWEVDLADGLDESSTDELHNLFDCLNQSGNFDPLGPLDTAMDFPNRSGSASGLSVAALVNALADNDVALLGWAAEGAQWVNESLDDATILMDASVEAIYGSPAEHASPSAAATHDGVVVPALSTTRRLAAGLLDGGEAARAAVMELGHSTVLDSAECSAVLSIDSSEPVVADLHRVATRQLSDAWIRAKDVSNNRRPSATGNSIRDLVSWAQLADEQTVLHPVQASLFALLSDAQVAPLVHRVLDNADGNGHLASLPAQLLHLSTVNASGNPLTGTRQGDFSVLESSLRMLTRANREMECTIPLVGIDVEVGNLSVEILRIVAQSDPGEFVERLDLLERAWGTGITQVIIEALVASGACDGIDQELLDDMEVIERLSDPEVEGLATVVHGLLNAVYSDGSHDRLQETVDLAAFLHESGALPLMEEVLRDLALADLTDSLIEVLRMVLRPETLLTGPCPLGGTPLSFDQLWGIATEASAPGPPSPLRTAAGEALFGANGIWITLDRAATLGQYDDAVIHQVVPMALKWARSAEPTVSTDSPAGWAANELVYTHGLQVVENARLHAAIADIHDGTNLLHFVAELVASDTVTVMLQTLDTVFDSLGFERSSTD
ncbi:MAG: hypothetical protein VX127_08330 [Myxococcota bacterium]|nr:hypothetical protein [Myxococcota bacterium]